MSKQATEKQRWYLQDRCQILGAGLRVLREVGDGQLDADRLQELLSLGLSMSQQKM